MLSSHAPAADRRRSAARVSGSAHCWSRPGPCRYLYMAKSSAEQHADEQRTERLTGHEGGSPLRHGRTRHLHDGRAVLRRTLTRSEMRVKARAG
jgi:hypothetical protein